MCQMGFTLQDEVTVTVIDRDLTKAMKATQSPIPMKSIRAQWPVRTHTQTTWWGIILITF